MKHSNGESPSATLFSASPHGLLAAELDSCLVRQQCKLLFSTSHLRMLLISQWKRWCFKLVISKNILYEVQTLVNMSVCLYRNITKLYHRHTVCWRDSSLLLTSRRVFCPHIPHVLQLFYEYIVESLPTTRSVSSA